MEAIILTKDELRRNLPKRGSEYCDLNGKEYVVDSSWVLDYSPNATYHHTDYTVKLYARFGKGLLIIDGERFEKSFRARPNTQLNCRCVVRPVSYGASPYQESTPIKAPDEAKHLANGIASLMRELESILQRGDHRTIGNAPYNELRELHKNGKSLINNYYKTKSPK